MAIFFIEKMGRARRALALPEAMLCAGSTTSISERDDEDQGSERAHADPDPLLLREAGGLQLLEILRELMHVLRRHLREALIDLLFCETVRGQNGRNLIIRRYFADRRQVGITGIEALVRRGLRWDRASQRGYRREYDEKSYNEEDGFRQTLGHGTTSFSYPAPRPATRRRGDFGNFPGQQDSCLTLVNQLPVASCRDSQGCRRTSRESPTEHDGPGAELCGNRQQGTG
jgi:hypothetical protein